MGLADPLHDPPGRDVVPLGEGDHGPAGQDVRGERQPFPADLTGVTPAVEPQRADGQMWQHFRAPDGNVYEIIGPE